MNDIYSYECVVPKNSKISIAKKEIDKEEFLRRVFLFLAQNNSTPADVLNSKFGEVVEREVNYVVSTVNVTMNYSGSLGYNRQEKYYDKNSNGELIEKTRTVTDNWQPYSGVKTYESDEWAYSGTKVQFQNLHRNTVQLEIKGVDSPILIYGNAINIMKEAAETDCRRSIKWPGDVHKNEEYSTESTCSNFSVIRIPYYEMEYEYLGKKYIACALALKYPYIKIDFPLAQERNIVIRSNIDEKMANYGENKEFFNTIKAQTKQSMKISLKCGELPLVNKVPILKKLKFSLKLGNLIKFAWLFNVFCYIFVYFLPAWSIIFPIISSAITIFIAFVYDAKYDQNFNILFNSDIAEKINIKNNFYSEKLNNAKLFFKNNKFELSTEDIDLFPKQINFKPQKTPAFYYSGKKFIYIAIAIVLLYAAITVITTL